MKLHFEWPLDFQEQAVNAVADLFRGQEICRTEFTVTKPSRGQIGMEFGGADLGVRPGVDIQRSLGLEESGLGIGNRLTLLDDELLENLHAVQLRNGLRPSETLSSGDFTVEMETGTGKTYVYLRTIFELNKLYGFTKFVIVVPSIAIKEGVYKTLQITREHFEQYFPSAKGYDFFIYDSAKPGLVRDFATSPHIRIMVITVGAINRFGDEDEAKQLDARDRPTTNVMYRRNEKLADERPIDLISATCPIVIIDEPQSVDGGLEGQGRKAIEKLKPLSTLRYSATHADKHHMVYRLDAVDAYERKLVKQISVAGMEVEGVHNKPYTRLISTSSTRANGVTARIELDVQLKGGGVSREEKTVRDGDDLEELTRRQVYRGLRVGEITAGRGQQLVEIKMPGDEQFLQPGQAIGDVDPDQVKHHMIRRTIKEHLDTEVRLAPLGIKVLSLFFIDAVDNYRRYEEIEADGKKQTVAHKGKYALMFEEEYRRAAKLPDYQVLFKDVDVTTDAVDVHNGYFSVDKKGAWSDTAENNQSNRDNAERAYNLIMRDKEKLLSFDTKLKFIFSHSALREGWDNPNVFQICALREIGTERGRRQSIGRGLRICVNQNGERVRDVNVNILTVIANESYETFADRLQQEIEDETGYKFGIVEPQQFAAIAVTKPDGSTGVLGFEESKAIFEHLKTEGLVNAQGKVQDTLRRALKENTLALPDRFAPHLPQVREVLRKLAGRLEIKDADAKKTIRTRQAVLDSPEFKALWDRIKHKTTYRVEFDNEKLIASCAAALRDGPAISKARIHVRKADLAIGKGGVIAGDPSSTNYITLDENDIELPDLLTDLQDKTHLTRRSIVRILKDSGRLDDFKRNPQEFIEIAAECINRTKRLALVDGIKYQPLGDDKFYCQQLFKSQELIRFMKNAVAAKKSVYEYVVYDSETIERPFAEQLEANDAVRVYAKLPQWFKVPTPLGTYNPDWAVLIERNGTERLYFVVETKGSLFKDDLRDKEAAKIACGKAHFAAIAAADNPARFVQATSLEDVLKQ
jgi:type III restriction enzyme